MLLKCFNCTECDRPFDCKEGMPNTPIPGTSVCAACTESTSAFSALLQLLNQPAFKKIDDGYVYNGDAVFPNCAHCNYTMTAAARPIYFLCGHVACHACYDETTNCPTCDVPVGTAYWFHPLLQFFDELARQSMASKTAVKEDLNCADCNISQPVERLLSCVNCNTLVCGICQFHQHREHNVTPLLGIELAKLKTGTGERYDAKLSGLHKNLTFLHQEVEKSIVKVIEIGNRRLQEVDHQTRFISAKNIATEVDVASNEFEQHCEEYIPAARVFNEKLTKLGEKLIGPAKN